MNGLNFSFTLRPALRVRARPGIGVRPAVSGSCRGIPEDSQSSWDRRIVGADSIGALAHLQLARAWVSAGDRSNAKAAYQDFLTFWKDADPDIPILRQARAEYAPLQ